MNPQNNTVEQLIRLIEREAGLYEELLDLTLRQRAALIENVESAISQTTAEQDRLLRQISATEKSSQAFAARLAQTPNPTLAEIAGTLDEPEASRLLEAAHRLLETGTRVRGENLINRQLINNALELTEFCLRALAGDSECPAYRIDGRTRTGSAALRGLLDSRA